jgi:hypothetical protein
LSHSLKYEETTDQKINRWRNIHKPAKIRSRVFTRKSDAADVGPELGAAFAFEVEFRVGCRPEAEPEGAYVVYDGAGTTAAEPLGDAAARFAVVVGAACDEPICHELLIKKTNKNNRLSKLPPFASACDTACSRSLEASVGTIDKNPMRGGSTDG